jgi:lactoylglutathione lyase
MQSPSLSRGDSDYFSPCRVVRYVGADTEKVMAGMRFTSLVVRCTDIERSRPFYEHLGLSFVPEQHGGGPRRYSCLVDEVLLELYPQHDAPSPLHFGLRVNELARRVKELRGGGASVVSMDATGTRAVVRDPDGHTLDLSQADPTDPELVIELADRDAAPFVLCAVLGTLEAIRAGVWSSEAGIWTLGRPVFLRGLSLAGVSATVREALEEADEWEAMSEPAAAASLQRVIECVRNELGHANQYWRASVRRW